MSAEREQEQAAAGSGTAATVVDSCARIGEEVARLLRALGPPEQALVHFRAARVEVLKGLRAAIDARIERVSQEPSKGTPVSVD